MFPAIMFDSGPAGVGSTEPGLELTPTTATRSESLNRAYKSEQAADVAQRLLARSERSAEGCLRWTGAHFQKRPVHIVAHEVWIGPVPEGYEVDHVHAKGCRHRDCIEPAHLEAVTHLENIHRAAELITQCPKGHEYTEANTIWKPPLQPGFARRRECRRCHNDVRNAWRARNRAAAKRGKEVAADLILKEWAERENVSYHKAYRWFLRDRIEGARKDGRRILVPLSTVAGMLPNPACDPSGAPSIGDGDG